MPRESGGRTRESEQGTDRGVENPERALLSDKDRVNPTRVNTKTTTMTTTTIRNVTGLLLGRKTAHVGLRTRCRTNGGRRRRSKTMIELKETTHVCYLIS